MRGDGLVPVVRLFVLVVPLVVGGSLLFGLWGLLIGVLVGGGLSAPLSVLWARRVPRAVDRDIDRGDGAPPSTSKLEFLPGWKGVEWDLWTHAVGIGSVATGIAESSPDR